MPDPRETPAMQQYYRFKRQHPGCVLLFRMGDFYETFDDDAVTIAKALNLTLTQRTAGVPMAGVPYHQLEVYLRKLVQQGFRVAVADQTEDASQAKGLVRRDVTRVVTPGTAVDDALLDADASNKLAAVAFVGAGDDSPAAIAILEVSTGDFVLTSCGASALADELSRRSIREVLFASATDGSAPPRIRRALDALGLVGTPRPAWHFRHAEAHEALTTHFGVSTLAGFGLADDDARVGAAGAALRYVRETQTPDSGGAGQTGPLSPAPTLAHLRPPRAENATGWCVVDAVSLRALEVERTMRGAGSGPGGQGPDRSLVGLFLSGKGTCRTPMGKRLVREWLCRPLGDLGAIRSRQAVVALLVEDRRVSGEVSSALDGVQDVARLAGRVALDRAGPRDLVALARSLARVGVLTEACRGSPALSPASRAFDGLRPGLEAIAQAIGDACVDDPPATLREGGVIRDGVDAELDEARGLRRDAGQWLAIYQNRLIREHNLPSLKVGYNSVFGYYIELPTAQARHAPATLERKQTLKNAERYTTPELREFERKVSTAEARSLDRERELFRGLSALVRGELPAIAAFADEVASLDAAFGLAQRAAAKGWTKPEVVAEPVLEIHNGRHPVLEEVLAADFVPNDCRLGPVSSAAEPGDSPAGLALITGPNMAGKSTYIRQVALITLLAHCGSFVPADRAVVGLTDRIFTRIGADDALHAGQSTFMVEMTETANILNHATARSLVVLDEIGRGTSTLDGLSLAWAIAEHLAGGLAGRRDAPGPRALFATHYHELTDLEQRLPGRVKNLHVSVREWPQSDGHAEIVFLHRILPGRTDQSYGIHVARLAGIPRAVIDRARDVLASLAVHHGPAPATSVAPPRPADDGQMMLFKEYLPHPALDELRELKLDTMSPMQAFDTLRRLRESLDDPARR